MLVCLLARMLCILAVYPVVLAAAVQTLSIDSRLGSSVEDCFDRISIGEQLPPNAIYRKVSELTTRECEQICKQDIQCQAYDYGVGAKGNASCDLSRLEERDLKASLLRHPDFDVYVRRVQCQQSPPSPIQPSLFDPGEDGTSNDQGPAHRPIHRPEAEDLRRPLSDYQVPDFRPHQLRPGSPYGSIQDSAFDYGTATHLDSPSYGPHKPESLPFRPEYGSHFDDFGPSDIDLPSYGSHRPENRPFRPKYGFYRPQRPDGSYRPQRPLLPQNEYNRPDIHPSDVLHFEEQSRPPYSESNYRPHPYPFQPINEITDLYGHRPNRPQEPYRPENSHYEYTNSQHNKPLNQPNNRPELVQRPETTGYGYPPQESPLRPEPFDPVGLPLPIRPNYPIRPSYSHQIHHTNGYIQNQNPENSIYTEISDPPRPLKPVRPGYGSNDGFNQNYGGGVTGYGYGTDYYHNQNQVKPQNSQFQTGYGTITEIDHNNNGYRPQNAISNIPQKPDNQNSGHHQNSNQNQTHQIYGSTSKPQDDYNPPSNHGYGSNQNSISNQGYETQKPPYGPAKPIFNPQNGYNDPPTYGIESQPIHVVNDQPSYAAIHQKPSFENQPLYGDTKPPSTVDRPTYSSNRPPRPYGGDRPDPSYGNQQFYGGSNNQQPEASGYGILEDNRNAAVGNKTHPSNIKPVYEHDKDRPSKAPSYVARPGGDVVTSRPMVIADYGAPSGREPGLSYKACFRRVLAGRRTLRSHVRRVVPCERLEDCRRECADERRFHCESFNYRLDPSFRGKGLCELMTKPIEAFNIRRDFVEDKNYDFYELDRNSLEPHCPETLKGPGFLHSGYLSSKSSSFVPIGNNWKRDDGFDGNNYRDFSRDHDYDRFHYTVERNHGRRRHPEEPYVPYQIATGRSDDQENWGRYGGVYGGYGSYYKNRNDYHKSINHWRLNDIEPSTYGVKPHGHHNSFNYHDLGKNVWDRYGGSWKRGSWDGSGTTGLDYGESNYYHPPRPYYESAERRDEPDTVVKDCTSRRRPGMSLSSGSIRRAILARNVVECESACFNEKEFSCVSYSFRYSNSRGTDNCFLSERPYRGLDLDADSGSDVYAMRDHGCTAVSHKSWVESECFWHVRSGTALSGEVVKAAITAAGLGACEAECIRAQGFFCRGFSFRFDPPVIGDDLENCILTSSPPTSLDNGRGLRPNSGHELYSRGNYGRGCEPALYDDVDSHQNEHECYLQYDNAAKLIGSAIKGQARAQDEESCGKACTDAPFRCLSFSFKNNAPPDKDNCLLSEIRLFDLQRGVDYEHSSDDWLFSFDLFNSRCHRKVVMKGYGEPVPELPHPIPSQPGDTYRGPGPPRTPGYLPTAPTGPSYVPVSGPPSASYPDSDHGFKASYPPERPAYLPEEPRPYPGYLPAPSKGPSYLPDPGHTGPSPYLPSRPGYEPTGPYRPGYLPTGTHRPSEEYPEPRPRPKPPILPSGPGNGGEEVRPIGPGDRGEPIAVSLQHYTVSGYPCRKGTTCAQNQVAGHWACEPEGGEIGSWDYCCAPTHRCGYSEGFHKPWCYVGPNEDQWRPCSEKYYPYHQHNVPHPSQGHRESSHRPRPWQGSYLPERQPSPYLPEDDRRYWDELYKNGPKAYYDQYGNPLPGYSRVPTAGRPYIKYHHNYPEPGGGSWVPVQHDYEPPQPGLGVARYWPVAYLHKGPPPNMTYFQYKDTQKGTTEKYNPTPLSLPNEGPALPFAPNKTNYNTTNNHRDEKTRNMTAAEKDLLSLTLDLASLNLTNTSARTDSSDLVSGTLKEGDRNGKSNDSDVEMIKPVTTEKEVEKLKGISGKIDDFSGSVEILDIEDAKKEEKKANLKTLEAEERQIEAIGRLLASRRDGKLVIEKRSQKELETKNIALDKELLNFDFGNKFPANERRGIIQKVTKEEIEKERNTDKSLEVSETTFVRPPRVLSTTTTEKPAPRKALVNGKVFYDATLREQRDVANTTTTTSTIKPKSLRPLEERAPSVLSSTNNSYGRKNNVRPRNVNPVRKVRRVYRRRYNPGEVRKRLLEKEKSKQGNNAENRKA